MRTWILSSVLAVVGATGCGGPWLQSLPHLNPTYMAVGFAALAATATARYPEWDAEKQREADSPLPPAHDMPTVPEDVLDRLDALQTQEAKR
jgi:hypothetical protein|nr:hypothetical protein [Kofleriaceae bacterium]